MRPTLMLFCCHLPPIYFGVAIIEPSQSGSLDVACASPAAAPTCRIKEHASLEPDYCSSRQRPPSWNSLHKLVLREPSLTSPANCDCGPRQSDPRESAPPPIWE